MAQGNGEAQWDVAIIGGGPAGTTVGSLLKKYSPELRVLILEKEKFPRDHIGESQLPTIGPVLDEMGVWEKIEGAGFPVKIGASYTWGKDRDRWNFDFIPVESYEDADRPGTFEGQRRQLAFQVDRSIYDEILLNHAESVGCEVRQETLVRDVPSSDGRIEGLVLDSGETITARHYVDATGAVQLLRRKMGIGSWSPDELKNIAFWDYWQDAEWAVEIGTGATRIQIRSLPYGWMWFIPLGPTRTSIGLVTPVEWYKSSGKTPEEIYHEAIRSQPEVAELTKNARPEGNVQSCKDWSNLADDPVGSNWFICGESAGFADPILSAGMTIAHNSGREVAYTILELERGEIEEAWLRERYHTRIHDSIKSHIRFAQYWYAANSCFTDLKDHCQNVAKEAGIKLTPEGAWRWLSLGGFTSEIIGSVSSGSFGLTHTRRLIELFDTTGRKKPMLSSGYNVFKLRLDGAEEGFVGLLDSGRIQRVPCYRRDGRMLPVTGVFEKLIEWLGTTGDAHTLAGLVQQHASLFFGREEASHYLAGCFSALDALIQDGWVTRSVNKKRPVLRLGEVGGRTLRHSKDEDEALKATPNAPKIVDRLKGFEQAES